MPKVIDAVEADGDEREKLMRATKRILRAMEAEQLGTVDAMNVLTNLVAEIGIVACIDRENFLTAMGQTYDLHIEHANQNETLN